MSTSVFVANWQTKNAFELGKFRMDNLIDAVTNRVDGSGLTDAILRDLVHFHDLSPSEAADTVSRLAAFVSGSDYAGLQFITEDYIDDYNIVDTVYYARDDVARKDHLDCMNEPLVDFDDE